MRTRKRSNTTKASQAGQPAANSFADDSGSSGRYLDREPNLELRRNGAKKLGGDFVCGVEQRCHIIPTSHDSFKRRLP